MSAEDEELAALAREIEALEAEERAAAMAAVREAPRGEDDEESP
jgi:hypothetical protein